MADAYEPYHVPQQSRRDKLRILSHAQQSPSLDTHFQFHPSRSSALFPLLEADFVTCAAAPGEFHANTHFPNPDSYQDPICATKPGETHVLGTLMGLFGGVSVDGSSFSSSSAVVHGGERAYDQSFDGGHGGEVVVFKPEPLSLSLSSHHSQQNNFQRFGNELVVPDMVDGGGCAGRLGPFMGYASILKGSRFLKPAQQLLEEFCNVGRWIEKIENDDSLMLFDSSSVESLAASCGVPDGSGGESRKQKSKLITFLDEV